jgi:hypothetical protein
MLMAALGAVVVGGAALMLSLLCGVLILPRPHGPARQSPWNASQT